MKTIITLLLILFLTPVLSQEYKIVQINAKWNKQHTVKLPTKIEGAHVDFGYLEEQKKSLQDKIQAVPIIILWKDNKVVRQWSADLSFKLVVKAEEIAYAIREDKQKFYRRKTN